MFKANIICDSLHSGTGSRLTTFELTYPRFIHAEFMTHRAFSRNSSSSRAIPIAKMLNDVLTDPVIPIHWGANQKGMQADEVLSEEKQRECEERWIIMRDQAVTMASQLSDIGLHKQIANRLLEPWMWITVIATGTERGFQNFFKLRCHEAAEPHMQKLAYMMQKEYAKGVPKASHIELPWTWHLPFVSEDEIIDIGETQSIMKSVARCARGSYLQHNGNFSLQDDLDLYERLSMVGHWSPFEHQGKPDSNLSIERRAALCGNFGVYSGWVQHRKTFIGEDGCQ